MSKGSFFLKTDVTSAHFKFSGNSLLDYYCLILLHYCLILQSVCSDLALCHRIFGGILLCVVALFGFKPLFSFLMFDSITCLKRKVLVFSILFLMIKILGWNWCFTIIFSIGSWMFQWSLWQMNFHLILSCKQHFQKSYLMFCNFFVILNNFIFISKF